MENIEFKNGCRIDDRPESAKQKDFYIKEIVASVAVVDWKEKPESKWRKFPDLNQFNQYSCVMQTARKIAGVLLWLKEKTFVLFSTAFYQMRSNKPEGGMIGIEAFEIWRNNGLPLEQLVPSDKANDVELDDIQIEQYEKDVAKVFAISGHLGIDNGDFETVASVIQTTGKAIMSWFYFTNEEWSKIIPTIENQNLSLTEALRHSVAVVDFFLVNGKKYLLIEDSAHFGGLTRRLISEEFFKARNWFNRYPMTFKFQEPEAIENIKPKYEFKTIMKFGQTSDDIKALQDCLKYEGLFPINADSTGYYGAITVKAVLAFQLKYNVALPDELNQLAGRQAGPKTLAKLNELYS